MVLVPVVEHRQLRPALWQGVDSNAEAVLGWTLFQSGKWMAACA